MRETAAAQRGQITICLPTAKSFCPGWLRQKLTLSPSQEDAVLLHKDPDFEKLASKMALEALPYNDH